MSAYENEVAERCAEAILDYLVKFGPQRRAVIRREVLEGPRRAEFEPAYKGALIDNLIERMAFEKLAGPANRRAESIELWYALPSGREVAVG